MIAQYRKALAALAAGAAVVVASGLLTGNAAVWLSTAVAALTATLGVAAAPKNAEPKPKDAGSADVGTLLLVAVFIIVLILLLHGRLR